MAGNLLTIPGFYIIPQTVARIQVLMKTWRSWAIYLLEFVARSFEEYSVTFCSVISSVEFFNHCVFWQLIADILKTPLAVQVA